LNSLQEPPRSSEELIKQTVLIPIPWTQRKPFLLPPDALRRFRPPQPCTATWRQTAGGGEDPVGFATFQRIPVLLAITAAMDR
jgi:hypothetical protein